MTTTTPLNKIGGILTCWDGTEYDKYGVKHIALYISDTVKEAGALKGYRHVQTVAINANGKPGQRGMNFWVTDDGSVRPVNAHLYSIGDRSHRSTFSRVSKDYVEHKLANA